MDKGFHHYPNQHHGISDKVAKNTSVFTANSSFFFLHSTMAQIPPAFMKAFLESKEVMKAIEEVIQDQIKSNLKLVETRQVLFNLKIEFIVYSL